MTSSLYLSWLQLNFGFVMFLLATLITFAHKIARRQMPLSEVVYRWFALFPLGIGAIYCFYMHIFHPVYTATLVGWATSPFQYKVAMGCLGFGLIAILSFKASYGFRLATVLGNTIWLWGDIAQCLPCVLMKLSTISTTLLWLKLFLPLILLLCLYDLKKKQSA